MRALSGQRPGGCRVSWGHGLGHGQGLTAGLAAGQCCLVQHVGRADYDESCYIRSARLHMCSVCEYLNSHLIWPGDRRSRGHIIGSNILAGQVSATTNRRSFEALQHEILKLTFCRIQSSIMFHLIWGIPQRYLQILIQRNAISHKRCHPAKLTNLRPLSPVLP